MILYNSIGKDYNNTRSADPKIVEKIITIFKGKSNCKIADIGAGTGNYSYELAKHGFKVYALEPSDVMYNQRKKHKKIKWIKGFAENIPFKDNYFDGVICILSSHHFTSLERFLKETVRILKINRSLLSKNPINAPLSRCAI